MIRTLLMLTIVFSGSGCALQNWMFPPADFGPRAPCRLSPQVTKDQLVEYLNKNIQGSPTSSGIASWRSTNVKISATGMPPGISAPASIAVEAPRNFRLRVSEPLTRAESVDMGSNLGHFWFWAKDAEPQRVITVSHDDLPSAQRDLRVPFHPDWLMEVFGVIPLDPAKFTLRAGPTHEPTLELISHAMSAAGEPQRKVIRIDGCHGIIREHALYDGHGVMIARAALADHRIDAETGLVVPHVIRFDWVTMRQQMTLEFGSVELNPPAMPPQAWQIPNKSNSPRLDLSQVLKERRQGHPALRGFAGPFGIVPPQSGVTYRTVEHREFSDRSAASQFGDEPDFRPSPPADGGDHPGLATLNETPPESEPPKAYSPAASQSSSGRRRPARGLWRWPFR